MNRDVLKSKITTYLNQNAAVGRDGIESDDQDLIADGIIDSFGLLGLIAFLEDEFSIRIDASDIDPANFNTISKIIQNVLTQF